MVDVYHPSKTLNRRQLPLLVDESLTMVMDLRSLGLLTDHQQLKGKEIEDFGRKMSLLTEEELNCALQVTHLDIMHVLGQSVPCVGCRRSVERLYHQLYKHKYPTFDPLMVTSDGIVTVREDKQALPQFLCSLFHGHSARLNNLVDSQPRRNKKSHRCLLHSLDSQRSRPVTPIWRDVWGCMRPECRRDVCIIDAASLRATLETYLRKHRFCSECRTKVQKAYVLLIEDPEPCKEKGYVNTLYAGIKRCIQEKHIHLQTKTEYIAKLIGRAEPELLGSRRERHAKTLEIAQEEVLTCIGICMYERLHRIYMRMREEECTCQVFAAVAVNALWRSFETAVESKQGISQLELLYAELSREEQQKQLRKEQKKLKRKRKKSKQNGKEENCGIINNDESDEKNDLDCRCKLDNSNDNLEECYCCEDEAEKEKAETDESRFSRCDFVPPNGEYDCGYSSENNNGFCETESLASSLPSSPDGSELACSDTCCHLENETESAYTKYTCYGSGDQLSLERMLEDHFYCDDADCFITPEEVDEFKSNNRKVSEEREQLRETLRKRFAQLCANGLLHVPGFLVQSKITTN